MRIACVTAMVLAVAAIAGAQKPEAKKDEKVVVEGKPVDAAPAVAEADSTTENTVTVGGVKIAYKAIAGRLRWGTAMRSTRCWGWMGSCWRRRG